MVKFYCCTRRTFSRIKHDSNFPYQAIKKCIDFCSLDLNKIDYFCFYEKPFLKLDRLINTYFAYSPKGYKSFHEAFKVWSSSKVFQKSLIIENLQKLGLKKDISKTLMFSEHHLSHAASAFTLLPLIIL